MRLLLLNHNLRERGTWHRAWQLARQFVKHGHQVTLWTTAPHHYYRSEKEIREGAHIIEMPSWAPIAGPDDGWGPIDIAYRSLKILYEPFDLCYTFAHPPNVFIPTWLAASLRKKPILYDWCDWYEGGVFQDRDKARTLGLSPKASLTQQWCEHQEIKLERRMLKRASRMTVISQLLMEQTLHAGYAEEDVLLIPNGADTETIRPLDRLKCRQELELDPKGSYLAYVANYHPDQELLLRALAYAVIRIPTLRLIKTGPPFAENLIRELNLESHILDLGQVDAKKIPLILGASDVCAMPLSDSNANRARVPYKFTDYIASGRPIITCMIGDLKKWFSSSMLSIGWAGAPDPYAFGIGISTLFSTTAQNRETMGECARRLAENEFSWNRAASRIEAFWQPLFASSGALSDD